MRRRRQEEEHDNHERWLVSYADFITLLFAFFVVMYAISSVNEGKYKVLSSSLVNAFHNTTGQQGGQVVIVTQGAPPVQVSPAGRPDKAVPTPEKQVQREKMRNIAKNIMEALAPLVKQGKVKLLETSRGVTIEINDSILFAPGQAKLQPASISAMQAVAVVLAGTDFPITIEGHTDNIPINTAQFPSNWELSALRATTVLRLFNDSGVGAERLTAIGYGDTRPVETNLSVEGRARNRRVSIQIDSERPEEPKEIREQSGVTRPQQP